MFGKDVNQHGLIPRRCAVVCCNDLQVVCFQLFAVEWRPDPQISSLWIDRKCIVDVSGNDSEVDFFVCPNVLIADRDVQDDGARSGVFPHSDVVRFLQK